MRNIIASIVLTAAFGMFSAKAEAPVKKRVAVFNFDNATAQNQTAERIPFIMQQQTVDVGRAVSDLLVTQLVQRGACTIIERKAVDKLLSEQNLSNSDRTDVLTAAKIGKILGVDAIILGSVTRYGRDDKHKKAGGGGFGGIVGVRGSIYGKQDIKAVVQVSARLVRTDTAEVVAVAQGNGEAMRKNVEVQPGEDILLGGRGGAGGAVMDEAVDKAVSQLAVQIEQNLPNVPRRAIVVEGLVADSKASGRLVLNVGSAGGAKVGDRLQVWKAGKPILDPGSGKVLRYDDTLIGEAVVTDVDEGSSVAMYSGTEPVTAGDRVRSFPRPK